MRTDCGSLPRGDGSIIPNVHGGPFVIARAIFHRAPFGEPDAVLEGTGDAHAAGLRHRGACQGRARAVVGMRVATPREQEYRRCDLGDDCGEGRDRGPPDGGP